MKRRFLLRGHTAEYSAYERRMLTTAAASNERDLVRQLLLAMALGYHIVEYAGGNMRLSNSQGRKREGPRTVEVFTTKGEEANHNLSLWHELVLSTDEEWGKVFAQPSVQQRNPLLARYATEWSVHVKSPGGRVQRFTFPIDACAEYDALADAYIWHALGTTVDEWMHKAQKCRSD